jgi:hypothetical protein
VRFKSPEDLLFRCVTTGGARHGKNAAQGPESPLKEIVGEGSEAVELV